MKQIIKNHRESIILMILTGLLVFYCAKQPEHTPDPQIEVLKSDLKQLENEHEKLKEKSRVADSILIGDILKISDISDSLDADAIDNYWTGSNN